MGLLKERIGVIGCGTMGSAILRGLLAARVARPTQLIGADPATAKRASLRRLLARGPYSRSVQRGVRVRVAPSNRALVQQSTVVILAVKPQELVAVARQIAPALTPRHLAISIAAGLSTRRIEAALGPAIPLIRVMPNTPAQIRQGMSVICRGRWARDRHARVATTIFGALGEVLELPERQFHAVTAVSGSGPAYLFFLMEQMFVAGRRLGLPAAALERLVRQTVVGSAQLAAASEEPPSVLRARVTSKGGTTEAALRSFAQSRVPQGIVRGLLAAAHRSAQLGS